MPPKDQAHFRLERGLLQALKNKAEEEHTTITELVTRFLKQGLGIQSPTYQEIDISQIEERVFERISKHVTFIDELEARVSERISQQQEKWLKDSEKQIANRASELTPVIDIAAIEERISNCISKLVPQALEKYLATQECVSLTYANDYTQLPKHPSEVEQTTPKTSHQLEKEQERLNPTSKSEAAISEEPKKETNQQSPNLVSGLPLFGSIEDGETVGATDLVKYLNEAVDPNAETPWKREKLRLLKRKLLTYLKKPPTQRGDNPPCPLIIHNYMIDWIPSENEPINSYGRHWWIQRLPVNSDEAEKLITVRRERWKICHDQ
jgi:hypothetical protein